MADERNTPFNQVFPNLVQLTNEGLLETGDGRPDPQQMLDDKASFSAGSNENGSWLKLYTSEKAGILVQWGTVGSPMTSGDNITIPLPIDEYVGLERNVIVLINGIVQDGLSGNHYFVRRLIGSINGPAQGSIRIYYNGANSAYQAYPMWLTIGPFDDDA